MLNLSEGTSPRRPSASEFRSCFHTRPAFKEEKIDTAREQALCGLCLFELERYDEADKALSGVFTDDSYVSDSKAPAEQIIFASAMHCFSVMTRVTGSLEKSVAALNKGIEGVSDEDLKASLVKELGRYKKKMFSGWKYA